MSLRVRIQIDGDRELMNALQRMGKAGLPAAKKVLKAFTDRVVPQAKAITPVEPEDGGALRDSVRATRPTLTSRGVLSVGVLAGGAPLAGKVAATHHHYNVYAVVQHEDLTLRHTDGESKFIEKPFVREAARVPGELLEALDDEVKKAM